MTIPIKRVIVTEEDKAILPDDPPDLKSFLRRNYLELKRNQPSLQKASRMASLRKAMQVMKCSTKANAGWLHHKMHFSACTACDLACDTKVFYRGWLPSPILIITESPSESDFTVGTFMGGMTGFGHSGRLVDEILISCFESLLLDFKVKIPVEQLIPYTRWCLTNLICCPPRSPEDDNSIIAKPTKSQIHACHARLAQFTCMVHPYLIISMGQTVSSNLPKVWSSGKISAWPGLGQSHSITPIVLPSPEAIHKSKNMEIEIRRCGLLIANGLQKYVPFEIERLRKVCNASALKKGPRDNRN